jgi:DNA replication protein DnaC
MDFKTKYVKGVCDCGNPFEGVVPDFANVTQCDSCVMAFQNKRDADRRSDNLRDAANYCGIPAKFREWDDQIAKEVGSQKLYEWLIVFGGNGKHSVWIGGTNGIGKTHTVHYRCYRMIEGERIYPYCVRSSSWLREVVTSRSKDKGDGDKMYHRAIECKLFVLDDFGKERLTEPRAELLYDIIDERDRRNSPIWITTNFSGQELIDRINSSGDHEYGYAILKRLQRMISKERIWK